MFAMTPAACSAARPWRTTSAFLATAAVVVLLALIVEMDALHGFFTPTDLTSGQWLACAAVGSAILWAGELVKIVLRARARRRIP